MKQRMGFVSNSSSSSFVLLKEGLSSKDINTINDAINETEWGGGEGSPTEFKKFWIGNVSVHSLGDFRDKIKDIKIDPENFKEDY
jgi:hypothetical protein